MYVDFAQPAAMGATPAGAAHRVAATGAVAAGHSSRRVGGCRGIGAVRGRGNVVAAAPALSPSLIASRPFARAF